MRFLVVDDDFTNRIILQELIKPFGECHVATDGNEAVKAVRVSLEGKTAYDAIFLDIMMPNLDGQAALKQIRAMEGDYGFDSGQGTAIIMVTALSDKTNIMDAFKEQADGYLVKPIDRDKLVEQMKRLNISA